MQIINKNYFFLYEKFRLIMANFQAKIKISILLIVLFSPIILSLACNQQENDDDSMVTSPFNSWNNVKSFVQEAQNKYSPQPHPNLE